MSTRRFAQSLSARCELWRVSAWIVASCALGCTLDKLDIVSQLPCRAGSARPECAPEAGGPDPTREDPSGGSGGAVVDGAPRGSGAGAGSSERSGGELPIALAAGSGGASDGGVDPVRADIPPPARVVNKLDLLFMIDNSISMRDKQNVLGLVNTTLITRLASPPCVPITEGAARTMDDPCPAGEMQAFSPITDTHIGIITSSLGDAASNVACASGESVDMAHLLGSLPRGLATGAAPEGFSSWTLGSSVAELTQNFQRLTAAVGEGGCGWEMPLESWYRFLLDPVPYRELARVRCPGSESVGNNCVQPATDAEGRVLPDVELLRQRELFLRPDSLVAIVMLTDENDCSVQVGNQSWIVLAIDDTRPMFRASTMCESNPNHPCCYSCPLGPAAECGAPLDPVCVADMNRLSPEADGKNLRCFDQKRRFGVDFLYPTERYVNALTKLELCSDSPSLDPDDCASRAALVANPLYAGGVRTPRDVFLAGIVGVPWQDLAASVDAQGNPLEGDVLRFKSAAELGPGDWARILGDPRESPPIPPSDPFMRESSFPRAGVPSPNPINGHEYDTTLPPSVVPDDLEYACIFPLPVARDCGALDPVSGEACDCVAGEFDTPLCEREPGVSPPGTTQYWAKAYPGLRQLDVLRGYGANSVVTSICARKVSATQAGDPDFAYRPALNALVERLQQRLGAR